MSSNGCSALGERNKANPCCPTSMWASECASDPAMCTRGRLTLVVGMFDGMETVWRSAPETYCLEMHTGAERPCGSVVGRLRIMENDAQEGMMHLDPAAVVVDEPKLPELVHEEIDAGAGRPDHFREHFL